jgi:hypothetical protein|tara:strand:- start:1125 stop:1370 length:246 start_codon:yes stop_codon:yes gene_type:complete
MTDITKYRNVSLTHETYKGGHLLSTKMFKGLQVSMSQLIESLISQKIKELGLESKLEIYKQPKKVHYKKKKKKLNGKVKKV